MTREQIFAWELSCKQRDQQQNGLSPEVDNAPPTGMCKEAGCPPGILWEFLQQWKIRDEPWSLSYFQILWFSVPLLQPRNVAGLSRERHQSTRVILTPKGLNKAFTDLSFGPGGKF